MFTWLEKSKVSGRWRNKELHYWAFQHGDLQIRCGDYVLIHNDESSNPEDIHCCFVAQVKDLLDTGNIAENPHQAIVQWYSRVTSIPPQHILLLPNVDYKQELFQEDRCEWSTYVDAETIVGKCTVVLLPHNVPEELYLDNIDTNGNPLFYCKWKYNGLEFDPVCITNSNLNTSVQESVTSHRAENNKKISCSLKYPFHSSDEDQSRKSSPEIEFLDNAISHNYLETEPIVSPINNGKTKQQMGADLSNFTVQLKGSSRKLKKQIDVDSELEIQISSFNNCCTSETSKFHNFSSNTNGELHQPCTVPPVKLHAILENKHKSENAATLPFKICSHQHKNNFITIPSRHKFSTEKLNDMMTCIVKLNSSNSFQKSEQSDNLNKAAKNTDKTTPTKRPLEKFKAVQKTKYGRKVHPVKPFIIDWKNALERGNEVCHRRRFDVNGQRKVSVNRSLPEIDHLCQSSDTNNESAENDSDASDYHKILHNNRKRTLRNTSTRQKKNKCNNKDYLQGEIDDLVNFKSSARNKCNSDWKSSKRQKSVKSKSPLSFDTISPLISSHNGSLRKPHNSLEEAREKLHSSAIPGSLPCREYQFSDIYTFIKGKLLDGTGGCMYISGVPGTGKTATVLNVVRTLRNEQDSGYLPKFHFIEINGMRITEPHQCYVQILKALTGQKAKLEFTTELLQEYFTGRGCRKETVLLMIDELDLLWTRKQTVMYNLFDWPSHSKSKLIVVAIANTMDLPERMMKNRVVSRLGLTRMTFQPYTYKQLQEIILSRMKTLQFPDPFDPDAVQLAARKVAAVSGDARRVLDICRRATEIAEEGVVKLSPKKGHNHIIGIPHVEKALQEMFSSPMIVAMRSASLHEKLFLKSIVAEFQRTGVEETIFADVFKQHISYCRLEGISPPTTSEAIGICVRLGSCRLLLLENGYCDVYQRIRLNVSSDDVRYALIES